MSVDEGFGVGFVVYQDLEDEVHVEVVLELEMETCEEEWAGFAHDDDSSYCLFPSFVPVDGAKSFPSRPIAIFRLADSASERSTVFINLVDVGVIDWHRSCL